MSGHTPGPWEFDSNNEWITAEIKGVEILVAQLSDGYYERDDSGFKNKIPTPSGHNARLIAAAPEMLEALQDIIKQIDIEYAPDNWKLMSAASQRAYRSGINAIAKAEGR